MYKSQRRTGHLKIIGTVLIAFIIFEQPVIAEELSNQSRPPKPTPEISVETTSWFTPKEEQPSLLMRLNKRWVLEHAELANNLGASHVCVSCDLISGRILLQSFVKFESVDAAADAAALATLVSETRPPLPSDHLQNIYRCNIEFYKDRVTLLYIGAVPTHPDAYETQF